MVILNQTNYFSKDRQLKMLLKLWDAYFYKLKFYLFHRISWIVDLKGTFSPLSDAQVPLEYPNDHLFSI